MQCQKDLKVVDSVQTQICPYGVPERKGPQQHCSLPKRDLVVYLNIQHCPSLYTKKHLEKFMSSQVCPHTIKTNGTN